MCASAKRRASKFRDPAKPFVFTTARNLLIDRVRREQIVPIEAVADLDALGIAADEPGPDRSVIAREELRRLQAALDRLPPRCREAVVLQQIEGLSRREIASAHGHRRRHRVAASAPMACARSPTFFYGEPHGSGRKP